MQRLLAITALTWKAAFRFRLFWVLSGFLIASVVLLPLVLKDDGTARGFSQIMLTYSLSVVTALLGFSTLWLACGTLARDIEDCQLQMVAVKPISRWQIWLGKWLGILLINASLLALSGGSIYGLLHWQAKRLPPKEQEILRNEIFVSRASLTEVARDIEADVEREFEKVPNRNSLSLEEQQQVRGLIRSRLRVLDQHVPPNHLRRWKIDLGLRAPLLRDRPLFLRAKFHAAQTNLLGTYTGIWVVGPPAGERPESPLQSMAPGVFHELAIPPNLFDENGILTIDFENRSGSALIFPSEDGFEVLYREGGFALNFVRGLGIILCWLSLLAALGLTSASFLSFPVAAFFSISVLFVALSTGTLSEVVQEGSVTGANHETGERTGSWIDFVLVPMFKLILKIVGFAQGFGPVEALSTGRSITWLQLGRAFVQVVLFLGGLVSLAGITLFTRRELATAQGSS
jgi:hypothetical protein